MPELGDATSPSFVLASPGQDPVGVLEEVNMHFYEVVHTLLSFLEILENAHLLVLGDDALDEVVITICVEDVSPAVRERVFLHADEEFVKRKLQNRVGCFIV